MQVRRAQSSDIPFIAWAMHESMLPGVGRGIFDLALTETGVSPQAFHEALLRADANNWGGLHDFLILEDGARQPMGAAAGYKPDAEDLRPLTAKGFRAVSEALRWPLEVSRKFWQRYVSAFGFFGNAPKLAQPADYVIEYVAISPAHRGKGLVRMLLDAHAQRARRQGCPSLGISAMVGNDIALKAYLKYGFSPCVTLGRDELGDAFPGIIRLMLKLEPVLSKRQEDVLHDIDI